MARGIVGDVREGSAFEKAIDRFVFALTPSFTTGGPPAGWFLTVQEKDRTDDLSILTDPPHGSGPTHIFAWHFRNDDNTGPPNDGSNDAPGGRHREFIFSPEVGRSIHYDLDTLMASRERVASFGRGTFDVLEYWMTSARLGEEPRLLRIRFAACLTWPSQ